MVEAVDIFEKEIKRSGILIEALPYIQQFRGQTMVIKYGGSAMEDPQLVASVLKDIVFLEAVGINPVIVHGGGKAITRKMKEKGISANFIGGLRVTDRDSVEIVKDVLDTEINPQIVSRLNEYGGQALSFSGSKIFRAQKAQQVNEKGEAIDLGFVGEVTGCHVLRVLEAVRNEEVPVISPIGCDHKKQIYNVNADVAAAEMAISIGASKVIFLSDVNGILKDPSDPSTRISSVTAAQVEELKKDGTVAGGMLPKVDACLKVLEEEVEKVHLIDGRIPHALLLELFTDKGIGTEIIRA